MVQGGDFTKGDGTGGFSIYGPTFPDENFKLEHSGVGLVSMANSGENTNTSLFFILTCYNSYDRDFLDGSHVVFGKVVEGMPVVWKMNEVEIVGKDRPAVPIIIEDCGVIELSEPYDVSKRDAPSDV
eukprot:TRINITY_DN68994_c0_g1_i1.p1 TRINITY_DN68994_c0_g1~~TRINITY_DN68994_c0_g1_i1.p1  ORF type:complete len:127 (-),score=36.00 TRINITY_DN68994_c0_g1_i1:86-466(-)